MHATREKSGGHSGGKDGKRGRRSKIWAATKLVRIPLSVQTHDPESASNPGTGWCCGSSWWWWWWKSLLTTEDDDHDGEEAISMQMAMKWNLLDVSEGNVLEPENQADTLMQPDTASALADQLQDICIYNGIKRKREEQSGYVLRCYMSEKHFGRLFRFQLNYN